MGTGGLALRKAGYNKFIRNMYTYIAQKMMMIRHMYIYVVCIRDVFEFGIALYDT